MRPMSRTGGYPSGHVRAKIEPEVEPSMASSRESFPSAGRLLRAFGSVRARRQMSADTTLIYLAVGQLGLMRSGSLLTLRPVTYHDISVLLKIPKETVRRKAARLIDLELIQTTTQGLMLRSIEEWLGMVDSMMRPDQPAAP